MLIAQISDTHIRVPKPNDIKALERINFFKKCVVDINSLSVIPDVVIHTGDLTDNGLPDEYCLARNILSKLKIPFYPTPGNRDGSRNMINAYAAEFKNLIDNNFMIYAVDEYPIRLISFDSLAPSGPKGDLNKIKLKILEKILNQVPEKPSLIFMHHPPFDVSNYGERIVEYKRPTSINKLYNLLKNHKQIAGIFCGHIHRSFSKDIYSFKGSVAPPIALDLSNEKPSVCQKVDQPIYHLHKIQIGSTFETVSRQLQIG